MILPTSGRSPALAASLVAILSSGCMGVTSRYPERGAHLRTVPIEGHRTIRPTLEAKANGVFTVGGTETLCPRVRHEYQAMEQQFLEGMDVGSAAFLAACIGAGGGLLAWSSTMEEGSTRNLVQLSAAVPLIALVAKSIGLVANPDRGRRVVPVDKRVLQEQVLAGSECSEQPHTNPSALPWTVKLGEQTLSGTTPANGELAIRDVATELVKASAADEEAFRKVLEADHLLLRITLGHASGWHHLEKKSLPDRAWSAWGQSLESRLDPVRGLTWAACGTLGGSARGHFDCFWRPEEHAARLLRFEGELASLPDGDFGSLSEFNSPSAGRFTYLVLPRAPGSSWLVRVVDVETGAVLAEDFTPSNGERLTLSGSLPRSATYAVVHAGQVPGAFDSVLTLGSRPASSGTGGQR